MTEERANEPTAAASGRGAAAPTAYLRDNAWRYDALRFTSAGGRAIHDVEARMLWPLLERLPRDARVLDVGCGTGRFLVDVAAAGLRVEGLDASPDMLEQSRAKLAAAGLAAPLHLGECGRLPFADGSFDLVYCIRVLNQTESAAYALAAVAELLRIARPGGRVLVEFVNAERPRFRRRRDVRLTLAQIAQAAAAADATVESAPGAFFFGMTGQLWVPRMLRPALAGAEGQLARKWPQRCARRYATLVKSQVSRP